MGPQSNFLPWLPLLFALSFQTDQVCQRQIGALLTMEPSPFCLLLYCQAYLLKVVSSTFKIAQILVQSHFELVSSVLALDATEPLSEPVTQMAVELINNHLISVQQKR